MGQRDSFYNREAIEPRPAGPFKGVESVKLTTLLRDGSEKSFVQSVSFHLPICTVFLTTA